MAAISLMGLIFIIIWVVVDQMKKGKFPEFAKWFQSGWGYFPVLLPLAIVTLIVAVQNYAPTAVRDTSSFGRSVLHTAGLPGPLAPSLKSWGIEADKQRRIKQRGLVGKTARSR